MPIIQRPDLVAKIRTAFDLGGPDAINTISPEVVPVVLLEDLVSRRDPSSSVLFAIGRTAATGANSNQVQLWNPVGSGIIVILKAIFPMVTAAIANVDIRLDTNEYTALATGTNRNLGRSGAPAAELRSQSVVVPTGGSIIYLRMERTFRGMITFDYAIPEGQGVGPTNLTGGEAMYCSYIWEEHTV